MIYRELPELQKEISRLRKNNRSIGFVPTMGALHQGHLSLVSKALAQNDVVIVSIFVNPTQFDRAGDLKNYPRTVDADARLLGTLQGTILIYVPTPEEVYKGEVKAKKYRFGGLEHQMEGKFRDGHFDGVGTVLNLLFRSLTPHKAYFGEKDFQQLQIVRKLVEIEKLPIEIIGCPIAREPHGMAMSSRNKRLSQTQFKEAALIHQTLSQVQKDFSERSIPQLKHWVEQAFAQNPHLELEYFEIAAVKNLRPALRKRSGNDYRAFIAAFAGEVRLIDNMDLA
ncbi:MAG: pantoate--beta-alanine ligase [Bacteroidota bacterium]